MSDSASVVPAPIEKIFFCPAPNTKNPSFSSQLPPLGTLYLAGTAEALGKQIKIYDPGLERDTIEHTAQLVLEYNPDMLCITCYTETRFDMQELAGLVKSANPRIIIVVGGPHVTFTWEETLKYCKVDIAAIGEGEAVLRELLSGKPLEQVPGIAWRDGENIRMNPPPERIENLDELPPPARHLIDLKRYTYARPYKYRCTQINTNRGCPFGCAYCSASLFWGRKSTQLSAAAVIERIKFIYEKYGFDVIFFYDDEFLVNKKRAMELMKLFREETPWLKWITSIHFSSISDDLLEEMGRSLCHQLNFGVETFNPNTFKMINRKVDFERAKKTIAKAISSGIKQVNIYLLIGLPGDSPSGLRQSFIKALSMKATIMSTQILRVYPGTKIDALARERKILPDDFHWYQPFYGGMPNLPTVPIYTEQPRELLKKQYKFLAFYLRITSLLRRNMPKSFLSPYIFFDVLAFRLISRLSGLFKG